MLMFLKLQGFTVIFFYLLIFSLFFFQSENMNINTKMNQSLLTQAFIGKRNHPCADKIKKEESANLSQIVVLVQLPKKQNTHRFIGGKIHEN